jgi:hypothetical protein
MKEEDYEFEPDWGCTEDFDEDSGMEPEWDWDESNGSYECHSCNNGPCYQ